MLVTLFPFLSFPIHSVHIFLDIAEIITALAILFPKALLPLLAVVVIVQLGPS